MKFEQGYTVEVFLCVSAETKSASEWFYMAVRTHHGEPIRDDIKVIGDSMEEVIANYEVAYRQPHH